MAQSSDTAEVASALLKNEQFMKVFEQALTGSSSGGLESMPAEGDPAREAWLKKLQRRLKEEADKAEKENLEKVQTDEKGQWMFIQPKPGFCLKSTTAGGGKVFVNVCQHDRIAEPHPMPKKEGESTDNDELRFKVPVSCSQAHPDKDKSGRACKVYDVAVNTKTLARCMREPEYRNFISVLSLNWIKQTYEPTLNVEVFRYVNFKVKGKLELHRIRLSETPAAVNAMRDEIKLPMSGTQATTPLQATSHLSSGKLIEEVTPTSTTPSPAPASQGTTVVLASDAASKPDAPSAPQTSHDVPVPSVVRVVNEGSYDWSTHQKPSQNVFFRETVPASYFVELYLPNVQTIREVHVCVDGKKLECFYVDQVAEAEDDEAEVTTADPFLAVVFDYPVLSDVSDAKFLCKTKRLKLRATVKLPDETTAPRTAASRDAAEEEAEEERVEREKRDAKWREQQAQLKAHQEREAAVMNQRKSYVEDLAAVQSGDIPPVLRNEVEAMPKEQLLTLLHRLEARVKKEDSVDKLMETLPPMVLDALIDYIRERLSLEPLKKKKTEPSSNSPADKKTENPPSSSTADGSAIETGENVRIEYNYAAKSEKLFGLAFHNRYLFALDS